MRAALKLLALLAVLLMPFGMTPVAAAKSPHHSATMPMQHCPEQAPDHGSKGGFVECTMACSAALPALDSAPQQSLPPERNLTPVAVAHILHGLHPETATPPPKTA
jgi:hypothetical protein